MNLNKPVTCIKGVSEAREKLLANLGVHTIGDLCKLYPRTYEDRSKVSEIAWLMPDTEVSLVARVASISPVQRIRKNLNILKVLIADDTGTLSVVYYNQPYIKQSLSLGKEYCFYGKITRGYRALEMVNPAFAPATAKEDFQKLLPVYPLTKGLSQNVMRKMVAQALAIAGITNKTEEDDMPEIIRNKYALMALGPAMNAVHFPEDIKELSPARRRLAFQELLDMAIMLSSIKSSSEDTNTAGIVMEKTPLVDKLLTSLPFKLSQAQEKVWGEIQNDMESGRIMNRLVMGDVGSGKTIIAVLSMVKAIAAGYQTAFMAPTEILAEQHYGNIKKYMEPLGIKVGLLTGSLTPSNKKKVLEELKSGEINCVIGTHALIQKGVEFNKPGLVITDEQHRFGVRQRSVLSSYSENCHVLVMTATPIPRTLALILYGDLDISTITALPAGRLPIRTYGVDESYRDRVYTWARKLADAGQQIYIVHPLIEENEELDLSSAEKNFTEASSRYFTGISTALVHGKMKAKEKDSIMKDFSAGKISVLFSTTVIEVGVDVANATLMIVENAERFGLAQLHQLRGRVGRGNLQSHCVLFNQGNGELTKQRIDIMVKSNDGFEIAQKDLDLRGPGEFFGTAQHGIPTFKIANLYEDTAILQEALDCAQWIKDSNDPEVKAYGDKVVSELESKLSL